MDNWRFKQAVEKTCEKLRAAGEKKLAEAIEVRALEHGNIRNGRIALCDGMRKLIEIAAYEKQL